MPPNTQTSPLQIALPGFDVRNCPDWAYLFNGLWPNLAIAFEKTVTVSGGMTIPHNLGFPPVAMAWMTQGGVSYGRLSSLEVDQTNIYLLSVTGTFTVRCYNIDVSKEASYPLPQSANAKLPYNNQFGGKFVKSGRAITSNNLNDFVIHTRAQSPAVLDVATQSGKYFLQSQARHYWPYGAIPSAPGWDLIVYPLQTSYLPWYVGALNLGANAYELAFGQQVYFDNTTNSLVVNITATGAGSLIILRDPLFYPNVISAVY